MSFMIAEEYFNIPGASWLFRYMHCIPVSRTGRDMTSVRIALRRLQDGRILCLFPEGSLSGTGRGRMRLAKRGAAYLALRSGAPIYPAFICGGPQHTHVPSAWIMPTRGGVTIGRPLNLSAYRGRCIRRKTLEEVGRLVARAIVELDPDAGKPPKPRPPLGENPYDRKRRRSQQAKYNHENTKAGSTERISVI
jgi:1-acyl-sn-glycerol-3-phosphate acyltransferase